VAYTSRRSRRPGIDIWPGFVDALSQLVMVIVFVLLLFTAGQFYLTDALSGRDAALQRLSQQLNQLSAMLTSARTDNSGLQAQIANLNQQLQTTKQQLQTTQQQLATAQAQGAQSAQQATSAQTTIDQLNQQLAALRDQLTQIAVALDISEAKNKDQQAQLADLGQRLNLALLSKVEELAKYRSEFFGRLREALGNRPDIQVVGDRFVFQSEVLFPSGSAALQPSGEKQLASVAQRLIEISSKIPKDINWVLQVDGHTDNKPINTSAFPSNWELSAARAIAVVKFLHDQGIPYNRLVAAGYGEFQPLSTTDMARNRRIELKLTNR
jgi:chemotaxis protein MotB